MSSIFRHPAKQESPFRNRLKFSYLESVNTGVESAEMIIASDSADSLFKVKQQASNSHISFCKKHSNR